MAGHTSMSAHTEASAAHSQRMDRIYRFQRHIYDATRKYYLLGRDQAIRELAPPRDGTVLEIGCGTARNLIAIARRYPRATAFGIDISREMLASAHQQIARESLGARVFLGEADATRLDPFELFGRRYFDHILFSYTLSMIPDWQGALRQAVNMLEPGGTLTIVDFGDQRALPRWFRTGLRRWLDRFEVTPRDDLPGWLDVTAPELGLTVRCSNHRRGYAMAISAVRN